MKELKIYQFQAEQIEDALRLAARALDSHEKATCMDRDIMQAWKMIKNVLAENIDERVSRL